MPDYVTAAAGPWGAQHPVDWAASTGRILTNDRSQWHGSYAADPRGTANCIAALTPSPLGVRVNAAATLDDPVMVSDEYAAAARREPRRAYAQPRGGGSPRPVVRFVSARPVDPYNDYVPWQ